ncbi:MAG: hypothetical protein WC604_04615 [Candidatus Gracilibacteria bacterium]
MPQEEIDQSAKFDAAIVIPCYSEGVEVIHTLASIARQKDIGDNRIGIYLVINNSRDAILEIVRSNQETSALVRQLAEERMPEGLSDDIRYTTSINPSMQWFEGIDISPKQAAEQILAANRLKLHEINLWEGENAPQNCNVGMARDIGTRTAIPHLRDNSCFIAHRDADSLAHQRSLAVLFKIYSDPNIFAVKGQLTDFITVSGVDSQEVSKIICARHLPGFLQYIDNIRQIILNALMYPKTPIILPANHVKGKKDPRQNNIMHGADMSFRATVYEKAQFPNIPGGEAAQFSHSLVRAGYLVHFEPKLITAVKDRFSDRATTGHGRSLLRYAGYDRAPARFPTISVQADKFTFEFLELLAQFFFRSYKKGRTQVLFPSVGALRTFLARKGLIRRFNLSTTMISDLLEILTITQTPSKLAEMVLRLSETVFKTTVEHALNELDQELGAMVLKGRDGAANLQKQVKECKRDFRDFVNTIRNLQK